MKRLIFAWMLFIVLMLAPLYVIAGEAVLSWDAPTTNTDNTCITDQGGYNVYHSSASGVYDTELLDVPAFCVDTGDDSGTGCGNVFRCNYTVTTLSDGMRYFVVTSVDLAGNNSDPSSEVSKLIDGTSHNSPTNVTVDINVNVTVTIN